MSLINSGSFLSGIFNKSFTSFSLNQPIIHVPNPNSAAWRQKCSAAIPISIKLKFLFLILFPNVAVKFDPSLTITIWTGACFVKWFKGKKLVEVVCAILFFKCDSSTTINFHGCELQAEGADLAASIHLIISSF